MLPILLAVVMVYLLNPIVNRLVQRGAPRAAAIFMAYFAVFIIVTSFLMYGIPKVVEQLNTLIQYIPNYTRLVEEYLHQLQNGFARTPLPAGMRQILQEHIQWGEMQLLSLVRSTISGLIGLLSNLFSIALAPVLAYYFMKDGGLIGDWLCRRVPVNWYRDFCRLSREIDRVISRFIRGHLIMMLTVGVLTWIALAVLRMEFAMMLGVFAGLTELIPYLGPFIGAAPAVALALVYSKWLALKVIIAIVIIQQVEANILSPKVLGGSIGLHPVFTILVLLAGGQVYGIPGMLLALPVTAVLRILIGFIWEKLSTEGLP